MLGYRFIDNLIVSNFGIRHIKCLIIVFHLFIYKYKNDFFIISIDSTINTKEMYSILYFPQHLYMCIDYILFTLFLYNFM